MRLNSQTKDKLINIAMWAHANVYSPIKIRNIRRKKTISVVFLLNNLACWKTELLYKAMLRHPRFRPILVISRSCEEDDTARLSEYLEEKGYEFSRIEEPDTICSKYNPDIIFYQKPYDYNLPGVFAYPHNLKSLFCFITYGFNTCEEKWCKDNRLQRNCWQIYYENNLTRDVCRSIMSSGGNNGVVTGLPMMDELLTSKEMLDNPWKHQKHEKKRIIWAPHHSINPENWIQYATFLDIADFMLDMAVKFSDRVQWAFKPHPLLRAKVEKVWGKEKTDRYWNQWAEMENSQVEEGKYLGLFKCSDAMIHDCASFMVEYMYAGNPVLYIMGPNRFKNNSGGVFESKVLDLHEKAYAKSDIEAFIERVIVGKDPLKEKRETFVEKYLLPPNGKTACDNIIDAILGDSVL